MKAICYQMLNVLKLVQQLVDKEMKAVEFSRTGWQVLFWLRRLGPCPQKELVLHMDIDAGQLARVSDVGIYYINVLMPYCVFYISM